MRTGFEPVSRNEMALKLRRRSVYVATIVAMLAMIGGLAMASFISTVTTAGQNGYSVTSAIGTSYASGTPSVNLVWTTASACTSSGGTISPGGGTANVYITGQATCQTGSADWFEELTFPGAAISSNPTDHFAVTVGANTPVLFTVSLTEAALGAITTNVFYEVGVSATATTSEVGITGD